MPNYVPNPHVLYRCPYCNRDLRLVDAGAVVDSYRNVCHVECLDRARGVPPVPPAAGQPHDPADPLPEEIWSEVTTGWRARRQVAALGRAQEDNGFRCFTGEPVRGENESDSIWSLRQRWAREHIYDGPYR